MHNHVLVGAALGTLTLSGCSGGGGGMAPTTAKTASPIVRTFTFPQGDAKMPTSGTAFDIIGVKTTLSSQEGNANGDAYDHLTIETTFDQDISKAFPPPGTRAIDASPSQLLDVVFFQTGPTPTIPDCASNTIRDNYRSDADTDAFGNYPIEDSNTVLANVVHGSTLIQSVPLSGLSIHAGAAIPHIGLVIEVSNGGQQQFFFTDCAPSIGDPISAGA